MLQIQRYIAIPHCFFTDNAAEENAVAATVYIVIANDLRNASSHQNESNAKLTRFNTRLEVFLVLIEMGVIGTRLAYTITQHLCLYLQLLLVLRARNSAWSAKRHTTAPTVWFKGPDFLHGREESWL